MKSIQILSCLLTLALIACASKLPDFYFSKGGVVRVTASAHDVENARQELLRVTSSATIQSGMDGGVLFEGVARSLVVDAESNKKIVFGVEKVIFGLPDPSPEELEVVSPPVEYGGIDFREGRRYRIYAVKLEGRYQTWSLTGTAELQ